MSSETFKEYSIPLGAENLPPLMVIEHSGKYYSFGRTCRTAESVWREVKDKLGTLVECHFTEEEIKDMGQFLVAGAINAERAQ